MKVGDNMALLVPDKARTGPGGNLCFDKIKHPSHGQPGFDIGDMDNGRGIPLKGLDRVLLVLQKTAQVWIATD